MNVALAKTTTGAVLDGTFAAARGRLPGVGTVAETRQQAFDDFARTGLPTRRIEEWKYTDLRNLLRDVAPLAPTPDQAALAQAGRLVETLGTGDTQKLVIVDGVFAAGLSDLTSGGGVTVHALSAMLDDATSATRADLLRSRVVDPMIALNAAFATDGMLIDIADDAVPARPLHIVHVATRPSVAAFTRSLVRIGNRARVTLVESFVATESAKAYQAHDAVVIWIGDDSDLQHVRVMEDAGDAANIATAIVTIGARTKFNTFSLTTGGGVSRYQSFITLAGVDSELSTNSVHLLRDKQHGDCTFVIEHAAPNCLSRELFRAVLDDRAHSVFQGRINVHQIAQKTDGKMMSRALLLSDEAEIDNKPELEIFADDVQCGHGATIGALDDSLLFYLRARGLPEKAAQALLIQAFVGEALESIVNDDLRDVAISAAERWLEARA
ncbi:Fe-S cluster assembly protein SufD [Tardiphaga sp. 37S4]|jgi:Fe-S cluster assembly protein SufD|uniref:Fe-S cluster assembly protein SufD n=1 Tax=Tardiphaga sp. 37S4 TaxID=1404741 RepID=UPI001E2993D2|nr:Fe-S cluster assembly protein SufD [Tardiphaga sp. 37S4]UFS77872.1 Fe-S cluster assembly protein SufD [Tardiphaga sp. 37S4]